MFGEPIRDPELVHMVKIARLCKHYGGVPSQWEAEEQVWIDAMLEYLDANATADNHQREMNAKTR
jgi:hypothetical protein